ncbi:MAG: RDD family protein [Gammaproteobacteria bacterium]|nr:RDD family protein [Gammaproteobacteria bacterium]
MSAGPQLAIDSATGVEVALPVAGAGGRAYAFVIDWHIRVALAIAWYGAGALLHSWITRGAPTLSVPFDPGPGWFLGVMTPTAGLYFLYHPVLEIALRGRTPGKRFAGLRIVTRDGGTPGIGALLVRNVFRLVDSFPAMYCVGLVATLVTRQHVRLGDLAAGTLLVYERERALPLRALADAGVPMSAPAPALGTAAAPPRAGVAMPAARTGAAAAMARAELIEELTARWDELAAASRVALARDLLQRLGEPADEIGRADETALRRRLEARAAAAEQLR